MRSPDKIRAISVSPLRWVAYATAGAATALGMVGEAAAEIHYSGVLDEKFDESSGPTSRNFRLSNGVTIGFVQSGHSFPTYDRAAVGISGAIISNQVRAFRFSTFYAANLRSGVPVSQGKFGDNFAYMLGPYPLFYPHFSQFRQAGIGFVGFKFDNGHGPQYGWARVRMQGIPKTSFILHDFAWGDPGEVVATGQTASEATIKIDNEADTSSLGLLALGGAGLEFWRHRPMPVDDWADPGER